MSTQYALTLFTRLGLQLLIVTPLQKIHVIEPYVSAVGFVDNPTGSYSRLQTLTIAEYKRRRQERLAILSGEGSSGRVTGPGWTTGAEAVSGSPPALGLRAVSGRVCSRRCLGADRGPGQGTDRRRAAAPLRGGAQVGGRFRSGGGPVVGDRVPDGGRRPRRGQPDPARVRVADFVSLVSVLGRPARSGKWTVAGQDPVRMPSLAAWAAAHPLVVLDHQDVWYRVLATVKWIAGRDTRRTYVRQIDVEGVDTKFVERHQRLLSALLPLVLSR